MSHEITITASFWQNGRLRLLADDAMEVTPVPLQGRFRWDVGPVAFRPPDPPVWVFEPRSLLEIEEAIASAPMEEQEALRQERVVSSKPHVVYIAFYGLMPKVGMTGAHRVRERLLEQGADAGFVVSRCKDRHGARRLEQEIGRMYGLPEFRRSKEVLRGLHRDLEWDHLEARADALRRKMSDHHAVEGRLHRVRHAWLERPLPAPAHLAPPEGRHAGVWIGARGRHIFYAPDERPLGTDGPIVHAIKHQDLVGRVIRVDGPE